ncbi:MAG: aminotransferase class I/II-fold pyridoxal phosphate-dependent enzyme [Bdellovibrionota bacterium]
MSDTYSYSDNKILQKANLLRQMKLYPFLRPIEATEGATVTVGGKRQVMIGSNNYLGLTHHPEVMEATIKAVMQYGTGCTGSRFLNGNLTIHEELEEKLARFIGHEAAILFSTGMQSNLGALPALSGPKDCLIFDNENHASLVDATRLAMGATFKYKHNDMEGLEEQLQQASGRFRNTTIVADGVFSMTGDIVNLPEMTRIAHKYSAAIYIDDAHGLGVLGHQGRGTLNHFELTEQVDFNMGTFSKSFASIGGFISGPKDVMDYIRHAARSFMFSASMPPSAVATVLKCLEIVQRDPEIHTKLWSNVKFMQQGFKDLGFYTYNSQTPIIPIFIGDDIKAMQVTAFLQDNGIFCTPVIPPAVPKGEALIRTSYMPIHTKEDLTYVLEIFGRAKKTFQIPTKQ